jgi:hypothetical protein
LQPTAKAAAERNAMTSLGCFKIAFLLGVSIGQLFQLPNSGIRARLASGDSLDFGFIYSARLRQRMNLFYGVKPYLKGFADAERARWLAWLLSDEPFAKPFFANPG